jgi:adenylate cyclase
MPDPTEKPSLEKQPPYPPTYDSGKQWLRRHWLTPSLQNWIVLPLLIWLVIFFFILGVTYFQTDRLPYPLLFISVMAIAGLIAPGIYITRLLVQRIDQIICAAEGVAQGDFSIRLTHKKDESELGRLEQAFNEMVVSLEQLQQTRDLLSRTMSPSVRQSLMEKGLDFRGIVQQVSVLFVDIRDFTHITELHHNTEQLVFFLNDYYTTIANQVHGGGGIIGKYGGDSILAYFGAPQPEPSSKSAVSALLTALALQDAIQIMSDNWEFLGMPPIRIGIGISQGPVIAGPIGSAEQFEYTVIGDAVNLASRLQALTRNVDGYNIIISAEVYEALEEKLKQQIQIFSPEGYEMLTELEKIRRPIQFIDLGEVLVKGKKGPVHVYGVPNV